MNLLRPDETCWRVESAHRLSLLMDAADYYQAFADAVRQASRSVYIAAWDLDSRIHPLKDHDDRPGPTLKAIIEDAVDQNPDVHVYILSWDFAIIYAVERTWAPIFDLGWRTHDRIHFHLDNEHPIGGSQHQKVVVVDDRVAFCGGIDLTKERWDTSEHRPEDPRRMSPDGKIYGPYHDLMALMSGPAARALGDLFRDRWVWATGDQIPPPPRTDQTPWPRGVAPDMRDTRVGLARTLPAFKTRPEVREVETFYLEAIRAAERYIYIESQYFSSNRVFRALIEVMRRQEGPEVVMVLPQSTRGWLEQATMGAIRHRYLKEIIAADHQHRFRALYPVASPPETPVFIHAKTMVVDGSVWTVGSSNLSNRSMGLDAECNIAVEARSPEHRRDVTAILGRLLGHHLGAPPEDAAGSLAETGSLIQTIHRLGGGQRTLTPLTLDQAETLETLDVWNDPTLVDPERPVALDQALDYFVGEAGRRRGGRKKAVVLGVGVVLMVLGLAAAWRWTDLSQWVDLETLQSLALGIKGRPWTPVVVLAAYLVAGLAIMPITLMVAATALVFDPWTACAYALGGCLVNAAGLYGLGRLVGRGTIQRLTGGRIERIAGYLAAQSAVTVAVARNVPVAPYSVVNMVAGASRIRFRSYILGTFLGMAPGVVFLSFFVDGVVRAVQNPDWTNVLLTSGLTVILGLAVWWTRKRLSARRDRSGS